MTIHQATDPEALTMRSFVRIEGPQAVEHRVAEWLREVDLFCGGRTPAETIFLLAGMVMEHFKHRSVPSLIMALRDGMGSTDKEGKVYGALTWPTVRLWLERHEEAVMNLANDAHGKSVVKNDNLGKDWMDRLERGSTKGVIERQERLIDQLRRKLENKNP